MRRNAPAAPSLLFPPDTSDLPVRRRHVSLQKLKHQQIPSPGVNHSATTLLKVNHDHTHLRSHFNSVMSSRHRSLYGHTSLVSQRFYFNPTAVKDFQREFECCRTSLSRPRERLVMGTGLMEAERTGGCGEEEEEEDVRMGGEADEDKVGG